MGVLILPATVILAWLFAIFRPFFYSLLRLSPLGDKPSDGFATTAMRWMMTLPIGFMGLVSGAMHTIFATSTAESIGWETNGFQYEVGFFSFGIGIAGIVAAFMGRDAWIVLSIVVSTFQIGAGVNHIIEIVSEGNLEPGNTVVLLYNFGLPISLWVLLFAMGALGHRQNKRTQVVE